MMYRVIQKSLSYFKNVYYFKNKYDNMGLCEVQFICKIIRFLYIVYDKPICLIRSDRPPGTLLYGT